MLLLLLPGVALESLIRERGLLACHFLLHSVLGLLQELDGRVLGLAAVADGLNSGLKI